MKMITMLCGTSALGYMSEMCEVVNAKAKGSSDVVRVNKSDFDADQAKDAADRMYSPVKTGDEPEQSIAASAAPTFEQIGMDPQAAPSAPDFSPVESTETVTIDPAKNAAAPSVTAPNQRLVMKKGAKFFVVDDKGEKLTAEQAGGTIDEGGYKTEQEAWNAILALPR